MRITIFGNHRRLASVAALGTLLCLTAAAPARAGFADAVKAQTLPNGLRVLVLENHKAPVSTFNVFYRVGSRNEQFGKTGLSHLCEHLMFKGTKKVGPEEFSQIIQQNGGEDNAFTESDFTDYFETINKDHIDVPITLEADRMANFEPKDFDKEKHVVLEERRLRTDDNPEDALDEMVRAQAYVAHPYHWPVIGWFHDVDGLTLADAMAYHKIYYSPQNALIVAVGDFDGDQVMKQISEAFAGIKNGPKAPPVTEVEPPQTGTRRVELQHAANLPAFEEAYHVPNLEQPGHLRARDRVGDSERRAELAAVQKAGGRKADGGGYRRRLRHDVVRSGAVRRVGADAAGGEGVGHAGGSRKGTRRDARQSGRRRGIAEGQES